MKAESGVRAMPEPAGPVLTGRLEYVDNLRVLLTVLVILLHLSIGYGAPGDWYYNEAVSVSTVSEILLTLFVALNQAFFMGFFFMVSSYFSPASLDRKGPGPYLRDRFKRLGIPMLVYALILNPLLVTFLFTTERGGSYWAVLGDSYTNLIGFGPTWFLEALLLFSIVLVVWRRLRPPAGQVADPTPPANRAIVLFALGLGLASFVVRIWLPVGWWLEPPHFQLAHFPQYIALYAVGVVAHRRGWFEALTDAQGRYWLRMTVGLVVLFPVLFVVGGALDGDVDPFIGGLHWQQLAFSLWEQLICAAIVVTLLVWYRNRFNRQGSVARAMSRAAYATYVIHAPVIAVLAVGLRNIEMDGGVKFLLVAPLAVGASFLAGYLIKRLPLARTIV